MCFFEEKEEDEDEEEEAGGEEGVGGEEGAVGGFVEVTALDSLVASDKIRPMSDILKASDRSGRDSLNWGNHNKEKPNSEKQKEKQTKLIVEFL